MRSTDRCTMRMTKGLAVAVAIVLMAAAVQAAAPADRLDRKIKVMERVIDEVLLQSEHIVVSSGRTTRGLVLDGYGVLFTFEGSLGGGVAFGPAGVVRWTDGGNGTGPFVIGGTGEDVVRDYKEQRTKAAAQKDADRSALQAELVDAMLDYGATLNELKADDWVVVAAFLGGGFGLGGESDGEQLVLKARYGDLQRFLMGDLSRQDAAALIQVARR